MAKKAKGRGGKGGGKSKGPSEEELAKQANAVKNFQKAHAASSQAHGVEPLGIATGTGEAAFGCAVVGPHLVAADKGGVTALHVRALLEGFSLSAYGYLQTLALWNVPIGNDGAAYLALYLRRRSCTLRSIELNDCGVGELGCKAIGGALEDNATVRSLQLDLNAFGDAGARALGASLPSNKGLTSLSMQYCGLTEAAGAILAGGVLRLPSLASLELRGNDLGSGGVVEVLRALVPLHAGGQPHPAMAHLGVADTGCAIEGELHEALTACFDENPLCGSFDMRGAPLGDTTAYELITLFKKVHTHVQAFEVSATSGWGPLDPQLYKQIYAVTAANQKGKKGGKKGKKGGKKKK